MCRKKRKSIYSDFSAFAYNAAVVKKKNAPRKYTKLSARANYTSPGHTPRVVCSTVKRCYNIFSRARGIQFPKRNNIFGGKKNPPKRFIHQTLVITLHSYRQTDKKKKVCHQAKLNDCRCFCVCRHFVQRQFYVRQRRTSSRFSSHISIVFPTPTVNRNGTIDTCTNTSDFSGNKKDYLKYRRKRV